MRYFIIRLFQLFRLYERALAVKLWLRNNNPEYVDYIQKEREFYSQFIKKGDLCFDVGANLGNKTALFLQLGATVVAIEPQKALMRFLRKRFQDNTKVILIQKALGKKESVMELMISDVHSISSMSTEWIKRVKISQRYSRRQWNQRAMVPVTTLDNMIAEHGNPVYCKIDVEGYEFHVLQGLSQPIKTISFEFTPEYIEAALDSIHHLTAIGNARFNYAVETIPHFTLQQWVGSAEIIKILTSLPDKSIIGEVYARFIS